MEEIINELFGSYAALALSVMGVCAALAAFLPAPGAGASVFYRVLYRVLNVLAANVGRTRNAVDVAGHVAGDAAGDAKN